MIRPPLEKIEKETLKIGVIGLGYVGLPLAAAFGKHFDTLGFDLNPVRIEKLRNGTDTTGEVSPAELAGAGQLRFTSAPEDLQGRDVFIVTVPTPVDHYNRPDLSMLLAASETAGKFLRSGGVVIYESTVYPGCTEEDCVPVIERASNLVFNRDFFAGYSPERINPGDKEKTHRLAGIRKIVSGSTPETAAFVDSLYRTILTAEPHRAPSIKVAEAAKVIENAQRDLNIAFVNELAKIFRRIGIDTNDVLDAAATKWNFLNFRPGLVGGHCIGVDPYYLTHKAQALGYLPEVILAGRRINDGMGRYIASEIIRLMIRKSIPVLGARVLQLGITFKENCPDIRNSHAADVMNTLEEFGASVDLFDPLADPREVKKVFGAKHCFHDFSQIRPANYDVLVLTVAHSAFFQINYRPFTGEHRVVYDVKNVIPRELADGRL